MSTQRPETPPAPSATPSPTRRLFPSSDRFIPKPERVFVNRNLRFSQILAIGFDLDHTLAHYDALPIEKLAFELTKKKLVEKRGYPAEVLRFKYDPDFVVRGLVVDRQLGNCLKMDYFRYVGRACHGLSRLDSTERARLYNEKPPRYSGDRFVSVDTLFHLPEVHLYLLLIDWLEKSGKTPDYSALYQDVRDMIDEAHRDGTLKSVITRNVGNFVRRNPQVPVVLDEFRRAGKRLFLLTNSEWSYSAALLRHLLEARRGERSWERFFDLIIVDSKKPAFFMDGPAIRTPTSIESETGVPSFSGGNAAFLEAHLGIGGDQILYFGDHTYGDILRSKKSLGWRTAMIVPEVRKEVAVTQSLTRQYAAFERLAHEHDQIELEKAALGREWRKLSLALSGEDGQDADALQILKLYDPRAAAGAAGASSPAGAPVKAGAAGSGGGPDNGDGNGAGNGGPVPSSELPLRLKALVDGSGSGPGGRRTRGDRRRTARLRELELLAQRIADLDHRASSLAGRIRSLRRQVDQAYNATWGSVFREGSEASRFGHQLKDFACVYTGEVSNFLHYPWNYYFQSPMNVMPHDL
ncbi:MAG: HAD-IG family 5'-nucleotidase [Candidatus Eiseniibacteriota bacterium]